MNTTKYFFRLTALTSISHSNKKAGTTELFNTESVVRENGDIAQVPYITGNAMKGVLRRLGFEIMLSKLGLDPEISDPVSNENFGVLTKNRLEVLFNGSILTSDTSRGIDVEAGARLSNLIPWFGIVGGCLGNQMAKSRWCVHDAVLICEENKERLEMMAHSENENLAILDDTVIIPSRRLLQREDFSHKDDFRGGAVLRYLPEPERLKLISAQAGDFSDRALPDWQDKEAGQHTQMRYTVQTLSAMSRLYWRIDTHDLTPLMEDAFLTTMAHFMSRPYIGGKQNRGKGMIAIECLGRNKISPATGQFETAVGFQVGEMYMAHLEKNREEIIKAVEAIAK